MAKSSLKRRAFLLLIFGIISRNIFDKKLKILDGAGQNISRLQIEVILSACRQKIKKIMLKWLKCPICAGFGGQGTSRRGGAHAGQKTPLVPRGFSVFFRACFACFGIEPVTNFHDLFMPQDILLFFQINLSCSDYVFVA